MLFEKIDRLYSVFSTADNLKIRSLPIDIADNRLSLAYLIVNYKHTVHNHYLAQKSFVLCIPTLRRIRQKYKS